MKLNNCKAINLLFSRLALVIIYALLAYIPKAFSLEVFDPKLQKKSQVEYSKWAKNYYKLMKEDIVVNDSTQKLFDITVAGFESIVQNHPNFSEAPKSIFSSAKLYEFWYLQTKLPNYLRVANKKYIRLTDRYPLSNLADDALYRLAYNQFHYLQDFKQIELVYTKFMSDYPSSGHLHKIKSFLTAIEKDASKFKLNQNDTIQKVDNKSSYLDAIQGWTSDDWSRILFKTSKNTTFNQLLSSKTNKNQLSLKLLRTKLNPELKQFDLKLPGMVEKFDIDSGDAENVVINIVLSEKHTFQIYPFENEGEYKIVLDIFSAAKDRDWGIAKKENFEKKHVKQDLAKVQKTNANPTLVNKETKTKTNKKQSSSYLKNKVVLNTKQKITLVDALSLKVNTIVIDPGHGGLDPGAINGSFKEKDLNLALSLKVKKQLLNKQPDLQVYLTRSSDKYIKLEDRAAFANEKRGDLFVSVHVNASQNKSLRGIETYYFDLTNDQRVLQLAAYENATSVKRISQLQDLLQNVLAKNKLAESKKLANFIQDFIFSSANIKKATVNLGVKQAPFLVLVGSEMPSVLIEVGFLSNSKELKLLKRNSYIESLASQITEGLLHYIQRVSSGYDYAQK